jgi:hypothetical protein
VPSRFFKPKNADDFVGVERATVERNISERWSTALMNGGWTAISNRFLESYSRLSPPITHGEAMFIVHLMQYKWSDKAPYPSLATIAKRMGVSTTSARSIARSLEKKRYLHREGQAGRTNRYHLRQLFDALESFREPEPQSKTDETTDDLFDTI